MDEISDEMLFSAKLKGFSDAQLAEAMGNISEDEVMMSAMHATSKECIRSSIPVRENSRLRRPISTAVLGWKMKARYQKNPR